MNPKRASHSASVLILVFVLLLAACGGGASGGVGGNQGNQTGGAGAGTGASQGVASGTPAGAGNNQGAATGSGCAGDQIVIGASLPLTGKEARVGGFYRDGYETAVKFWNEKGGITVNGQKKQIKLNVLDNTTNPTTSVSQYERLVTQDKVDFLLGSYSTLLVSADNVVAQRYKIPYVNAGGAASAIYSRGNKYLFGVLSSVVNLATTEMDLLKAQQDAGKLKKPANIALIWENTDHGKDFQQGVQAYAKKHPDRFKVVIDETFELGGQDYSSLLRKVKGSKADLFLADAHLEDFILMHRQYTEQGLNHQVVTYGARGSEKDAKEQLGNKAVAGVLSATWWSPELPYPQAKEFVEYYSKNHNGEMPAWYQALSFEAANTLFNSIQKAGSCDKEKVRDTLAKYNEPSLLPGNKTYFTETGQINNPFVVVQNTTKGESVLVWPKDIASAEPMIPMPK